MKLTIPYPPSTNRTWTFDRGQKRLTPEARKYRSRLRELLLERGFRPRDGEFLIEAKLFTPTKRTDIDNWQKNVLDALEGAVFNDDSQVMKVIADKAGVDAENPRVEMTIKWRKSSES